MKATINSIALLRFMRMTYWAHVQDLSRPKEF
jgi:hypothetical protein